MAKSTEQVAYSAEVHFAQRLAANEKKVRDRAVKKLRQWVSVRSQSDVNTFSELDLMKIWKGLFYCMWMSDKPLIQEELAETIAQLIHSFKTTSSALTFIDTFFQTMAREWLGIDRLRLDKFLMLVRRCLFHSFEMARRNDWNSEVIDGLMEVMKKGVLNPDPDKIPDGLRFHVSDIYLGELTKVGGHKLSPQETLKFVEPFCVLAAKTTKTAVLRTVVKEIFRIGIIYKSDVGLEDLENEEEVGEALADKEGDLEGDEPFEVDDAPVKTKLVFDYQAISECLYMNASDPKVLSKTRSRLYEVVKKLQDLARGTYPMERIEIKLQKVMDEEEKYEQAVMKKQKKEKRKKWRENKKKRKLSRDTDDEFSPKVKIKKKSNKTSENMKNGEKQLNTKDHHQSDVASTPVQGTAPAPGQGTDEDLNGNSSMTRKKRTGEKRGENEQTAASVKKDQIKKSRLAQIEKSDSAIDNARKDSKDDDLKSTRKTRSSKSKQSDLMDTASTGDITAETSVVSKVAQIQPFVKLQKVMVPATFVRKSYKRLSVAAAEKKDVTHATPPQKKRVEFALSMTTAQDPKDYKEQVKKSPLLPFDKKKKPATSALKSPELPAVIRKSTRKRKKTISA